MRDGVRTSYVSRGAGSPVVMLHGFPDTRRTFDLQVGPLLDAGFRVVTPDLRGYGASSKPRSGYSLSHLAKDVARLVVELDAGPLPIVGHDWGGAIAWQLATERPDLVSRLVILNAPHPVLLSDALLRSREQLRRSWYFFFFQIPHIPELWLTRRSAANVARMFRDRAPTAADPAHGIVQAAREAFGSPEAARAPVAYYREAVRNGLTSAGRRAQRAPYRDGSLSCPVTIVWGERDVCLGTELLDGVERFAPDVTVHRFPDAGHFVHHERPAEVTRVLLAALGEGETRGPEVRS